MHLIIEVWNKMNQNSYNCSSIASVLNEQQNPLSVGLSLKRSEQSYCLPYQKHSRNIPTPSSVTPLQVCITYNRPNHGENLSINVGEKLNFTCLRIFGNSFGYSFRILLAPSDNSLSLCGSSWAVTKAVIALVKSSSKFTIDLLSPFHGCVLRTLSSCR